MLFRRQSTKPVTAPRKAKRLRGRPRKSSVGLRAIERRWLEFRKLRNDLSGQQAAQRFLHTHARFIANLGVQIGKPSSDSSAKVLHVRLLNIALSARRKREADKTQRILNSDIFGRIKFFHVAQRLPSGLFMAWAGERAAYGVDPLSFGPIRIMFSD